MLRSLLFISSGTRKPLTQQDPIALHVRTLPTPLNPFKTPPSPPPPRQPPLAAMTSAASSAASASAGASSAGVGGSQPLRPQPDWAALPAVELGAVFRKLGADDILTGAGLVCGAWRRLAEGEPELWRRVDMRFDLDRYDPDAAEAMACVAADRSAGRMEAFWAQGFASEELLLYISERASSLKSLRLSFCREISYRGLVDAVKGFPQLEELELSFCSPTSDFEAIGKACPRLKRFRLNKPWTGPSPFMSEDCFSEASGISRAMPELQELQLFGSGSLNNARLTAILDNCPRLESLDVRHCFNVDVLIDDALRAKCARIKNLRLPGDSVADFEFAYYIAGFQAFMHGFDSVQFFKDYEEAGGDYDYEDHGDYDEDSDGVEN